MNLPHVSYDDVLAAADRIRPYVHHTPIATSATLNAELDAAVFFKCENLQKVGAFKARGATNAVLSLDAERAGAGVVTHSSGNHGQALAYAAAVRGIPAWVVMPRSAPAVKVAAVRGYGAQVVFCRQDEREAVADRVRGETGATLIHPFDDPTVIAGQGTATLELLEAVDDLDAVVAPIGGGGLLSGAAVVARARHGSDLDVVGAEPSAVDDAARSLAAGVRMPRVPDPDTIADGLLTGIGRLPFAILTAARARIVTVEEAGIVAAARFHLERMKLVVEPSGATGLAAVRALAPAGRRLGVILSGGNTDFAWLDR